MHPALAFQASPYYVFDSWCILIGSLDYLDWNPCFEYYVSAFGVFSTYHPITPPMRQADHCRDLQRQAAGLPAHVPDLKFLGSAGCTCR